MPSVQLGGQVEIDVATLEEGASRFDAASAAATAVWAPPQAAVRLPVDFVNLDLFEVQVIHDEQGPRLLAAIELISPANKDRPSHRRALAVKCASYLQQGVSVIVVDVVTSRPGNLSSDLFEVLRLPPTSEDEPPATDAVAYRTIQSDGQFHLEGWPESLLLGSPLPTLPLWLGADLVLPLDLEQSYAATCDSLRIGW